jgi:chemotaxis protein histidine kinase CheA
MSNDETPANDDLESLADILLSLKETYIKDMPALIDNLAASAAQAELNVHDPEWLATAINEAHKLKGTSGSYGLDDFSSIFASIEVLLKSIDSGNASRQDNIFSNVFMKIEEARNLL